MPDEIRYLGDLQLLKIEPGDRFVLQIHEPISDEASDRIRAAWAKFAGDVPLLILDSGWKLGAIRVKP